MMGFFKKEEPKTVGTNVAEMLQKMADDLKAAKLDERMMEGVDTVKTKADKEVQMVSENITTHPFVSVALAAGTGMAIGALVAYLGRKAMKEMM
jgi:ElaB/YqjD/DUF883 family membrane-anchored ribosome-binding protein